MQNYLGVAVLCIIPGLISYCISRKSYRGGKVLAFYVSIYAGILSAVKIMIHDGKLSVFESFADMLPATFIHYAPVLIGVSIIFPFIVMKGFKAKAVRLIYAVDAYFFFLFGIALLFFGKVTNRCYCFLLFCAGLLAFVFCYRNGEMVFSAKLKRKDAILSITAITSWVMTNLVFSTGELYLNNVTDFPVSFANLMLCVIFSGFLYIVLYTVCSHIFLMKKQYQLFWTVVCILTLVEYVQGVFLNGHLDTMEGAVQTWSTTAVFINGVIWLFAACAGILLWVRNQKAVKLYGIVCAYICLIQAVSLIYMGITTDFSKKDEYLLTTEGMLEVDDENNVIVFVLDWFDGQILEWIEEEDPAFLEPLKDFTDYKNTTSCYAYTTLSVPYLLSSVKYNNEDTLEEWCANAYTNQSLLYEIDRLGYDIGIYTEYQLANQSFKDIVLNYSEVERKCRLAYSIGVMLKCAKYKNMPFVLKDMFSYSTDDIAALSIEENEYITTTDTWIYNDLIQKKLRAEDKKDYKGAFRFLHFKGAHLPLDMNENCEGLKGDVARTHENWLSQAKGSLKIVYEYIEQMKQLGVYDNATIIITADHGQNLYVDNDKGLEFGFKDHTSNPILFVKQSKVTGKEAMTVSGAPVSHEEFAATVVKAMGGEYRKFGRSFDEIGADENRIREFIRVKFSGDLFIRYHICGNVRNMEDWVIVQ